MERKSIFVGVVPAGPHRIRFDFTMEGVRYRPTPPWVPHETNLRRPRELLSRIKAQVRQGRFASR